MLFSVHIIVIHMQAIRETPWPADQLEAADQLKTVKNLLEKIGQDACLDGGVKNYTALHFAAYFNKPNVVNLLIDDMRAGDYYC